MTPSIGQAPQDQPLWLLVVLLSPMPIAFVLGLVASIVAVRRKRRRPPQEP